jgi:hypothetical protein
MEVQSLLSQEYPMERVKLRHKQTGNVLRTDSLEQLDEDLKGVAKALNPESRIVQILSDDFAHSSWEARRYQRALSTIVRMALPEALYDMLTRQLNAREPKEARDLVEQWRRGDVGATAQVSSILKSNGLEQQDIEGEAVRRCLPDLLRLEQLISSAASRRDKSLAGTAFYREMVARRCNGMAKTDIANSRVLRLEHPRKKAE